MAALFASGRIVDLVLLFMVIEGGGLIMLRRRVRRGIPPLDLLVSLGAGAALLLALRGALTDVAWPGIAACLVLALVAHLLDLWRRWPAA
jgi:hypothetical protein